MKLWWKRDLNSSGGIRHSRSGGSSVNRANSAVLMLFVLFRRGRTLSSRLDEFGGHGTQPHILRSGFTLIELLVSVTLVVLMMLLFAEIFEMASGSMLTQRGIALNDQRSRTLANVVRNDLWKRTFRMLIPFSHFESDAGFDRYLDQRQGYFYISENDPTDDSDDVLQLTVRSSIVVDSPDETPNSGNATLLGVTTAAAWSAGTAYVVNDLVMPATPSLDPRPILVYRCVVPGNSAATEPSWPSSGRIADGSVEWQVANQNQADWDDGWAGNGSAESKAAEVSYFLRNGTLYRRVLLIREPTAGADQPYDDVNSAEFFDPAHPAPYAGTFWNDFDFSAHLGFLTTGASTWLKFNGTASLNNDSTPLPPATGGATNLYPFGNPLYRFGHFTAYAAPATSPIGMPVEYIGPAGSQSFIGRHTHEETSNSAFPYPIAAALDPTATLTLGPDGVVNQFRGGIRRAEDILMTNVHAFDVKVWDEALSQFVDVGHNLIGHYNTTQNANPGYGPGGPSGNNVFDTWHPSVSLGTATAQPPFPIPKWQLGTGYVVGNVVRPNNPAVFPLHGFIYQCVAATGNSGVSEPSWPSTLNATVIDGGVTWQAVPNLQRPLRAIQITIRFYDVGSDKLRQLTIVHSLVD